MDKSSNNIVINIKNENVDANIETIVKVSGNRLKILHKKLVPFIVGACISTGLMITHIVMVNCVLVNPFVDFELTAEYVVLGFMCSWFLSSLSCYGFIHAPKGKFFFSIFLMIAPPVYFFLASIGTVCTVSNIQTTAATLALATSNYGQGQVSLDVIFETSAFIFMICFVIVFMSMVVSSNFMTLVMSEAVDKKDEELSLEKKNAVYREMVSKHWRKIQDICLALSMTTDDREISQLPEIMDWLIVVNPTKQDDGGQVSEEKSVGEIDLLDLLQDKIVRTHLGVLLSQTTSGENVAFLSMVSDFIHAKTDVEKKLLVKTIVQDFIEVKSSREVNIFSGLRQEFLKKYANNASIDKTYFKKITDDIYIKTICEKAFNGIRGVNRRNLLQDIYRATEAREKILSRASMI
jgi:hypothetical protein